MLVKILDFGSNWWSRFGRNPADPLRFTRHAAYFNSTGLRCGRKVRRYWIIPGLLRFNGALNLLVYSPARYIGATFECANLSVAFGGNRLFFVRQVSRSDAPDYHLLLMRTEQHGAIDFGEGEWKSAAAIPLAISQFKARAEALFLMQTGDWVRTALGTWQLVPAEDGNGVLLSLRQQPS